MEPQSTRDAISTGSNDGVVKAVVNDRHGQRKTSNAATGPTVTLTNEELIQLLQVRLVEKGSDPGIDDKIADLEKEIGESVRRNDKTENTWRFFAWATGSVGLIFALLNAFLYTEARQLLSRQSEVVSLSYSLTKGLEDQTAAIFNSLTIGAIANGAPGKITQLRKTRDSIAATCKNDEEFKAESGFVDELAATFYEPRGRNLGAITAGIQNLLSTHDSSFVHPRACSLLAMIDLYNDLNTTDPKTRELFESALAEDDSIAVADNSLGIMDGSEAKLCFDRHDLSGATNYTRRALERFKLADMLSPSTTGFFRYTNNVLWAKVRYAYYFLLNGRKTDDPDLVAIVGPGSISNLTREGENEFEAYIQTDDAPQGVFLSTYSELEALSAWVAAGSKKSGELDSAQGRLSMDLLRVAIGGGNYKGRLVSAKEFAGKTFSQALRDVTENPLMMLLAHDPVHNREKEIRDLVSANTEPDPQANKSK